MILHVIIYILCQGSVSMEEVVCPLCSEAESKGVEVEEVGGRVVHLTFIQETGVCIWLKICNVNYDLSLILKTLTS